MSSLLQLTASYLLMQCVIASQGQKCSENVNELNCSCSSSNCAERPACAAELHWTALMWHWIALNVDYVSLNCTERRTCATELHQFAHSRQYSSADNVVMYMIIQAVPRTVLTIIWRYTKTLNNHFRLQSVMIFRTFHKLRNVHSEKISQIVRNFKKDFLDLFSLKILCVTIFSLPLNV